jgi:hypothetical protein
MNGLQVEGWLSMIKIQIKKETKPKGHTNMNTTNEKDGFEVKLDILIDKSRLKAKPIIRTPKPPKFKRRK